MVLKNYIWLLDIVNYEFSKRLAYLAHEHDDIHNNISNFLFYDYLQEVRALLEKHK